MLLPRRNSDKNATSTADGSFQLRDASTGNLLSYGTGPRTNEEAVTALVERPGEPGTWLISFAKGYPIIWRTDAKCAEITPLLMDMALAKPGEPLRFAIYLFATLERTGVWPRRKNFVGDQTLPSLNVMSTCQARFAPNTAITAVYGIGLAIPTYSPR